MNVEADESPANEDAVPPKVKQISPVALFVWIELKVSCSPGVQTSSKKPLNLAGGVGLLLGVWLGTTGRSGMAWTMMAPERARRVEMNCMFAFLRTVDE